MAVQPRDLDESVIVRMRHHESSTLPTKVRNFIPVIYGCMTLEDMKYISFNSGDPFDSGVNLII